MSEVYRAMKTLDFEWKVVNPYHVQVKFDRSIGLKKLLFIKYVYRQDISMNKRTNSIIFHIKLVPFVGKLMPTAQN